MTTPDKPAKAGGSGKRKSSVLSFFTLKEPSTQALLDYEAQIKAGSQGPNGLGLGMTGLSSRPLPPEAPKVNAKVDPHTAAKRKRAAERKNSKSSPRSSSSRSRSGSSSRPTTEAGPGSSRDLQSSTSRPLTGLGLEPASLRDRSYSNASSVLTTTTSPSFFTMSPGTATASDGSSSMGSRSSIVTIPTPLDSPLEGLDLDLSSLTREISTLEVLDEEERQSESERSDQRYSISSLSTTGAAKKPRSGGYKLFPVSSPTKTSLVSPMNLQRTVSSEKVPTLGSKDPSMTRRGAQSHLTTVKRGAGSVSSPARAANSRSPRLSTMHEHPVRPVTAHATTKATALASELGLRDSDDPFITRQTSASQIQSQPGKSLLQAQAATPGITTGHHEIRMISPTSKTANGAVHQTLLTISPLSPPLPVASGQRNSSLSSDDDSITPAVTISMFPTPRTGTDASVTPWEYVDDDEIEQIIEQKSVNHKRREAEKEKKRKNARKLP
jgi:hypothetical protein